jgi:hypothetical protein
MDGFSNHRDQAFLRIAEVIFGQRLNERVGVAFR